MRRLIASIIIFIILVVSFYLMKDNFIKKDYAVKINDFTMTQEEFNKEFKEANIYKEDSPKARRKFLDTLINRKLILQQAEKEGLHKSEEFLDKLENYYEQLLFNMIIERKSKEIGSKVGVSDMEVKEKYREMKEKGYVNKPLEKVYNQVKWRVFREKQTESMKKWLDELEKNADIEIEEEELIK